MKKDEKNVTNVSIDGDYVEEVVDDDKDDAGCLVEDDHNESQDHYKKTFFYTNNNNALKQNKKNSIKTSYSNSNNNDNNNNNNSNNKINTRDVLVNDKEAYIHLIISGVNSQEGCCMLRCLEFGRSCGIISRLCLYLFRVTYTEF